MTYTKADISLPFILLLSIAAVVLVSLYSSPVEKNDVLCGDNSTNQHLAKYIQSIIDYDGKNSETVNCFQFGLIVIGMIFSSVIMLIGELAFKGGSYFLRLLGLFISGICITVALSILLGNMTATHSPTFFYYCKPNPSIQQLCKQAVEGVKTYVKVNCTTSANRVHGPSFISYRASSFPLGISLMGYFTSGFFLWSMMLSSKEELNFRWFALIIAVIGMICMGCSAFFRLEVFLTDIGTGLALGFVVAVVCLGMMVMMYPKWRKHSIVRELPFTTHDLPPVKKGDKTTSPAPIDSSGGENEKKPPAVAENFPPRMYPSLT